MMSLKLSLILLAVIYGSSSSLFGGLNAQLAFLKFVLSARLSLIPGLRNML